MGCSHGVKEERPMPQSCWEGSTTGLGRGELRGQRLVRDGGGDGVCWRASKVGGLLRNRSVWHCPTGVGMGLVVSSASTMGIVMMLQCGGARNCATMASSKSRARGSRTGSCPDGIGLRSGGPTDPVRGVASAGRAVMWGAMRSSQLRHGASTHGANTHSANT